MSRQLRFTWFLVAALGTLVFPVAAAAEHGTNPAEMSPNMFHVANRTPTPPTGPAVTNSDLAFWQGGLVDGRNQDRAGSRSSASRTTRSRSRSCSASIRPPFRSV